MPKKSRLYSVLRIIAIPIMTVLLRLKFINKNHIPEQGAYILACNHISNFDPIVLAVGQKRQLKFMAKAELFKNKLLGKFLLNLGAFPVDRGKHDTSSVRHFEEVLKEKQVMGIFIEGTCSHTGDFLQPKNGVSLIAYHTKTPVIPACITKKGFFWIVHFGEPISVEELGLINGGAKEFRTSTKKIMDEIKKLREQDLS